MLYQAHNRQAMLDAIAGDSVRGFTLRNFCRSSAEERHQPILLVDNLAAPTVLVAHAGANCMVYGAIQHYAVAMRDLLEGNVEQEAGWPDPALQEAWEHGDHDGPDFLPGRFLFLNSSPFTVWRAAVTSGFKPRESDLTGAVAFLWHFQGEPRFSSLVQHPCRMVEGLELFELMRQGIGYDPEGHYVKLCLEHGPSFVCEIDGEPVCWSCTHLNGTMGMIYTPEQHRRKGYARSLSALQIDTMLKRDGIACCHVVDYNVASMSMVAELGAERCEEALVWREVFWPEPAQ